MPEWKIPVPIDIPWRVFAGGEHMWDVSSGHAWKFTYIIIKHPETGKWVTNLHDGKDHDNTASAVREATNHFHRCINRCLDSRPLEEFLEDLKPSLVVTLGSARAAAAIDALKGEATGAASFNVRALPWFLTNTGNMMTRGTYAFPWPFTHVVIRREDGWRHDHDEDPLRETRLEAMADAQKHFDARIERLVEGPLEHQVLKQLIEASREGPDRFIEVFRETYGLSAQEPAPAP